MILSIFIIFNFYITDILDKETHEIKNLIKKTFPLFEDYSDNKIRIEFFITENIEDYIIPLETDIKHNIEFKRLRVLIDLEIKPLAPSKRILNLKSEMYVTGWNDKVLLPPLYVKRKSKGVVEKKILKFLKGEELDLKYENPEGKKLFAPPFETNIDIIKLPDGKNQNETTISINRNKIVTGWNDYRNNYGGYVTVGSTYSHDAGITWGENLFPGVGALGDTNQGDPVIAFGNGDTVFFTFISFNRGSFTGDLALCKSFDGGKTWTPPINITNTPSDLDDKPWISVYGDTILITWARFFSSFDGIKFIKSIDGGNNFTPPVHINYGGNGSIPKKGRGDTIYVLWGLDYPQNSYYDLGIWISKSTNGGNTFSSPIHVADLYYSSGILPWRDYPLPSFDVDRNTGYIYVVFHSADPGYNHLDAYFTRSTNGGLTFEPPIRLNDDITESQFFPSVSVDDSGYVHVIWYDTRRGNDSLDIYYKVSKDYGQTFSSEIRVTDRAKRPYRIDFIGDYIQVNAKDYLVGADWCHPDDAYTSDDVWFARLKRDRVPPLITVIYPNGGETFSANDTVNVRFNIKDNSGISWIYFFCSLDSGLTYVKIDSINKRDSVFTWVIPDTSSQKALFKIGARDYVWNYSFDVSDSVFTIEKTLVYEKLSHRENEFLTQNIILSLKELKIRNFEIINKTGRKIKDNKLRGEIYFIKYREKTYKIILLGK